MLVQQRPVGDPPAREEHTRFISEHREALHLSKVQEGHPGLGGQRSEVRPCSEEWPRAHVHLEATNATVTKSLPSNSWNRCFYITSSRFIVCSTYLSVCVSSHSPHLVEVEPPQHEDEGRDEEQANGCNTCWKVVEKKKSLTRIPLIFHRQLAFGFLRSTISPELAFQQN